MRGWQYAMMQRLPIDNGLCKAYSKSRNSSLTIELHYAAPVQRFCRVFSTLLVSLFSL